MIATNELGLNPGFRPVFGRDLTDTIGDPNTIVDELFYRVVTGEINIDNDWDSYVKRWLDEGGRVLTEEANRQWKAQK